MFNPFVGYMRSHVESEKHRTKSCIEYMKNKRRSGLDGESPRILHVAKFAGTKE